VALGPCTQRLGRPRLAGAASVVPGMDPRRSGSQERASGYADVAVRSRVTVH